MCELGRELLCFLLQSPATSVYSREVLVLRLRVKEYCRRTSEEIVVENLNLFIVKGNKLSCSHHCTIPSGFELWLLLLACFILIKDEHVVSGPGSIYSLSGLQGDQVGALEKWWWFFLRGASLVSQPLGASDSETS